MDLLPSNSRPNVFDDDQMLAEYQARRSAHGHLIYRLFPGHIEQVILDWKGYPKTTRRVPLEQLYELYEDNESSAVTRHWKLWNAAVTAAAMTLAWLMWDSMSLTAIYLGVAVSAIGARMTPRLMQRWAQFPPRHLKSPDHGIAVMKSCSPETCDEDFREFVTLMQRQIRAVQQSRELDAELSAKREPR